jgi:hypothetical protein
MARLTETRPRVLAVYPFRRGFGFAVLEGVTLVDWGIARLHSKNDEELLVRVDDLVSRYQIALLALEDGSNRRRGQDARRRIERLLGFAHLRKLATQTVSRKQAWITLGLADQATNHDMCVLIGSYFEELQPLLPRKRRFFDNEDERTNVFRAVAIGIGVSCGS